MSENRDVLHHRAPADSGVYCMRCKERRPLTGARIAVLRNGRPVLKGRCPACGAPLFRIGGWVRPEE